MAEPMVSVREVLLLIRELELEWREAANRIGVGKTLDGWSWDVCIAKAHVLADLAEQLEENHG